jgi:hypothetical protein
MGVGGEWVEVVSVEDSNFNISLVVLDGKVLRKWDPSSKDKAAGVTPKSVVEQPFKGNCIVMWVKSHRIGPNERNHSTPRTTSHPPKEIRKKSVVMRWPWTLRETERTWPQL